MHMLAHCVDFSHRFDDAIGEVIGIRAREANATYAIHSSHGAKQIGKVELTVVIRIDGLAEQHDLRHASRDGRFDFTNDVEQLTASLRAARGRDDAIRAVSYTHLRAHETPEH